MQFLKVKILGILFISILMYGCYSEDDFTLTYHKENLEKELVFNINMMAVEGKSCLPSYFKSFQDVQYWLVDKEFLDRLLEDVYDEEYTKGWKITEITNGTIFTIINDFTVSDKHSPTIFSPFGMEPYRTLVLRDKEGNLRTKPPQVDG